MSAGVVDWSGLSRLGAGLAAGLEQSQTQDLASRMGAKVQAGDFAGAAGDAFKAGDLQTGLQFAKLGESKAATADYNRQFGGGLSGIAAPAPIAGAPDVARPAAPISAAGTNKAQAVVSGLISRGIDPKVAAAAAGNFLIESSFDNTNGTGDKGTAFGLGQWRNERFDALKRVAGQRGWQDIEAQLDHTAAELKGSHKGAYDAALAAPDASSAAIALMNKFEIPSRAAAAESGPRRAAAAARFYQQFAGGPSAAPERVAGMNPSPQRVQVASADPNFVPQSAPLAGGAFGRGAAPIAPADDPIPVEQRAQVAQAAPQILAQAGMKPQAVAQVQAMQPGSPERIQYFQRAMGHPGASEAQREQAKMLLANELQLSHVSGEEKEYREDVAQGFKGDKMAWRSAKAAATRAPEKDGTEKVAAARQNWKALGLPDPNDTANAAFWKDFGSRALGGGALVNVDTRAEGAESVGLASARIKDSEAYQTAGQAAAAKMPDIATLRTLSRNLGVQGAESSLKEALAPYAATLGVKLDGIGDIQAYSGIISKLTPNMRPPGSGATSDYEQKMYGKALPGLLQDPQARELVFDMMQAQAQGEVQRGDIATRYRNQDIDKSQYAKELRAVPNPLDMFRKFREANPTLIEDAIKRGDSPGRPLPQGQREASAPGALKPAPADELANARAAIAAKVPAEKVMEMMRRRGFSPAGL